MHTADTTAFAGIGFLAIGAIFSISDVALSRTSFELMIGPMLWIVGCALMVAWAIGRIGLAARGSDISDEASALREETLPPKGRAKSGPSATDSHTKGVAGHFVADFLAPLTIWLMLLSFLAVIVLLLG
jgi:hypothetical protein